MNILLLTNHLNRGGITEYLYQLCRQLHGKAGVLMWVASRGGSREKDFLDMGVGCLAVPLTTKSEASPKVLWSFFKLRSFLRRTHIDVMHANTRVTQVLASLLSRVSGVPVVSTCHGYFAPRLTRRLWPCWGKKVIAISDAVRTHLVSDFRVPADRVALVYNGVELERFRPRCVEEVAQAKRRLACDPQKKVVGHIGRLSSVKGQKYFVEAAARLRRIRDDIQFLLIGDGPEREYLVRLVKKLGLEDIFLMRPTAGDTPEALAAMDIFVMPSVQEGFGLSILEAQAQGVPVVASRVGGIPTLVEDRRTGLLVEPRDPEGLTRAVGTLLEDPALMAGVVESARRQAAERFSSRRMALETRVVYGEAVC